MLQLLVIGNFLENSPILKSPKVIAMWTCMTCCLLKLCICLLATQKLTKNNVVQQEESQTGQKKNQIPVDKRKDTNTLQYLV